MTVLPLLTRFLYAKREHIRGGLLNVPEITHRVTETVYSPGDMGLLELGDGV